MQLREQRLLRCLHGQHQDAAALGDRKWGKPTHSGEFDDLSLLQEASAINTLLLAAHVKEMANASGVDLRGDGICMIGSDHELYAVATLSPDSVLIKEVQEKQWGVKTAHSKTPEVTTQVSIRQEVVYAASSAGAAV